MSSTFTSENLQKIIVFPFRDEKWKSKFAVGGLFIFASIFIIPMFFIGGYIHEIMRRIIVDKREPSLPLWDDIGNYLQNGFKMWAVNFLFSSPAILLMLPYFIYFMSFPFMAEISEEAGIVAALGFPITMGLMMLGSLVSLVLSFLSITAISHMVAKGEFSAAFQIREWWPILRKNFGGYLLAFVVIMGTSWLAMFVLQILMFTIIFCFVFPFALAAFYIYFGAVAGALFAQAYNEGVEKLALAEA
jgi:hypothetical protein